MAHIMDARLYTFFNILKLLSDDIFTLTNSVDPGEMPH